MSKDPIETAVARIDERTRMIYSDLSSVKDTVEKYVVPKVNSHSSSIWWIIRIGGFFLASAVALGAAFIERSH